MMIMTHIDNDICTWNMMEYDHIYVCERIVIYIYMVGVMCDSKSQTSTIHTSVESGGGTCCSGRACQRSPRRRTCNTQSGCPPLLKDREYERETEDWERKREITTKEKERKGRQRERDTRKKKRSNDFESVLNTIYIRKKYICVYIFIINLINTQVDHRLLAVVFS